MLLLALQTTTSTSGDSSIDALTLVLVVIFIASMAVLTVLLRRGKDAPEADRVIAPPAPEPVAPRPVASPPPARSERQSIPANNSLPVWLAGVEFPSADASLSDATVIIEALLAARRDGDLRRGLGLYLPESVRSLRASLGIDEANLDDADFRDQPPALRSVELMAATGNHMTVRAGYSNGSSEMYCLIRHDGRWLIEEIVPGR